MRFCNFRQKASSTCHKFRNEIVSRYNFEVLPVVRGGRSSEGNESFHRRPPFLRRVSPFLILRIVYSVSISDLDKLRIRHAAVFRHVCRMYEAITTYRGILTVHSAHPDEEKSRYQRGNHDHQQQHHQTAHETRQTHADRLRIGGCAGVLYHHSGVVAGIRRSQRKIDVTRRDHLNDPRSIHVRHLLRRSFVHVGGKHGHRVIGILKIEDNRCNAKEFAS